MSQIVLLSKEDNIFFSIEDMCLFIQNKPSDKKLTGISFEVLKYLAECSPNYIPYQDIFDEVWVNRLDKILTPADSSRMREILQEIRRYLGEKKSPYKYIQSENGRCRCTSGIISVDNELISLSEDLENLTKKMSDMVIDLEKVQDKLELAKNNNNRDFIDIYSTHFSNLLYSFEKLQEKIELTKHETELIFDIQTTLDKERTGNALPSESEMSIATKKLIKKTNDIVQDASSKIEDIELALDELINAWMSKTINDLGLIGMPDTRDNLALMEVFLTLPRNRQVARALFNLTESYDEFDLYNLLFVSHKEFLTEEELQKLTKRAKSTYASGIEGTDVLKLWGIE